MQNKPRYLALLFSLGCAGAAHAESVSDKLTRIEAETLVLKAREKQLEVQSGILAKQADIAARQAATDRLAQAPVAGNPVVHSIEGIGRTMYATLQLDSGNSVDVQVGDILPNGMKVVSIRPNQVIAETAKKRRVRLAAAPQVPTTQNQAIYHGPAFTSPPMLPIGIPKGVVK